MPGNGSSLRDLRFGVFEVDVHARELRKKGSRVKLQQQPFELLLILLDRSGAVVTREDLRQKLWPANVYVDFDRSLNKAMVKLREALGDSSDCPLYIETLPRVGYRFIGPMNETPPPTLPAPLSQPGVELDKPADVAVKPADAPVKTADVPAKSARRTLLWIGIAVTAVLLISWPLYKFAMQRFEGRDARPAAIRSLAVLPLTNLSSDAGQDFFADGMTEELTTDLGKISGLRVISRTSTMHYKGVNKSLGDIARELNVDALVEGTVTRSGSHVRITASLLQASPERHLWAESYESEIGDAFAIQAQIAQALAREIQVKLTQQEQRLLVPARPIDPEAQDLYLRGNYVFGTGTAESTEKAINYFQRAVQMEPDFAPAYAGLANAYATWIPGMGRPRDLLPKAKQFALKALQLDDTLADAHSVLGYIELNYDWDWLGAEQEFKRTMELNPNHSWAHNWHARALVTEGREEEAVAEANESLALGPSPLTWDYPIWVFLLARRNDLASDRAQKLLEAAPDWVWARYEMAQVYERQGHLEQAARESLKADELFETDHKKVAQLKEAIARSGAQGYWRRKLENYRQSAASKYVPPVLVAEACLRVGDKECALKWLEKGFEEKDDLMINLKVEALFDALRADPRFQDLIRRVGIPQ